MISTSRIHRLLVSLLPVLFSATLRAGNGVWTTNGPDGGIIAALAVDPRNPSIVYAGSYPGLYKTIDGGLHWTASDAFFARVPVISIAIDPANPSTIYLLTSGLGLWKSTDDGRTWTYIGGPTNPGGGHPFIGAVLIDPASPSVIWAFGYDGLFQSKDAGATWTDLSQGLTDGVES